MFFHPFVHNACRACSPKKYSELELTPSSRLLRVVRPLWYVDIFELAACLARFAPSSGNRALTAMSRVILLKRRPILGGCDPVILGVCAIVSACFSLSPVAASDSGWPHSGISR